LIFSLYYGYCYYYSVIARTVARPGILD